MNIKRELRKLNKEISPRKEWLARNREILMSQIKAQSVPMAVKEKSAAIAWEMAKSIFAPQILQFVARPVMAVVLISSVVLGSSIFTVSASMTSVPGNLLYPIKITTENIQLGLASEQDKVKLEIDFAGRRLDEWKQTAAKSEDAVNTINKFKTELSNISTRLETLNNSEADKIEVVKLALMVNDKSADYALTLKQSAPEEKDALAATQDIADKTAGMIIESHNKVGSGISEAVVAQKVEDKISGVEDMVAASADKSVEAQKAIDEAKTLLESGDLLSAYNKAKESEEIIDAATVAEVKPAATTNVENNTNTNTNTNINANTGTGTIQGGVIEEPQTIKGGLLGQ